VIINSALMLATHTYNSTLLTTPQMGLFRANGNKLLKISTGRRQTSWLVINEAEELN